MSRPSARFLSQLAHDLRSPLNVIGSTLTELSQEPAPDNGDRAQIVTLSQRAVARLISLSDRLGLAARLEQPLELNLETFDLGKVTDEALALFLRSAARQRIEVTRTFPTAAIWVRADRALMITLLHELLANANRFARRQLRIVVAPGPFATVTVEDDGKGVNEDERARLFEPFAERQSHTGLGMGLWLARRLAELHEGTVVVEHLAVGTRQQLQLPNSQ
jgi:signal transduction histidine kinase